eukprot:3326304-Prymnesium_polylepis.2
MAPRPSMHLDITRGATVGACGTVEQANSPESARPQKCVSHAHTTCGLEGNGANAVASCGMSSPACTRSSRSSASPRACL